MISEALRACAYHHLRPIDRLVLIVLAPRAAWTTSVQCEQREIAHGLLAVKRCGKSRRYRLNDTSEPGALVKGNACTRCI